MIRSLSWLGPMRTPWSGVVMGAVFVGLGTLEFVGPHRFTTGGYIWLGGGIAYIGFGIAGRVTTGSWRKKKHGNRDSSLSPLS